MRIKLILRSSYTSHQASAKGVDRLVQETCTSIQYSPMICPSETVVPRSSMTQKSAVSGGLHRTRHDKCTLRSPRSAVATEHSANGPSTVQHLQLNAAKYTLLELIDRPK